MTPTHHSCTIRQLPRLEGVQRAVGVRRAYWPNGTTITIAFLEGTAQQQQFVKTHAVEWLKYANLTFEWVEDPAQAAVRITFRNDGAWSYLGTDCHSIPGHLATMNYGWLDRETVLHEFGHMLGLAHEQSNPKNPIPWNKPYVYKFLGGPPNNWSPADVDWQVFYLQDPTKVDATNYNNTSIMQYGYPSSWTLDGSSAPFNKELSEQDKQFIRTIYPKPTSELHQTLADIFRTGKELGKLTEPTVLRIGWALGLEIDARANKSVNVRAVADELGL